MVLVPFAQNTIRVPLRKRISDFHLSLILDVHNGVFLVEIRMVPQIRSLFQEKLFERGKGEVTDSGIDSPDLLGGMEFSMIPPVADRWKKECSLGELLSKVD